MVKKVITATILLLCLSACATTSSTSIDNALAIAETTFSAAQTVVSQDAASGLLTSTQAAQISGFITAGSQALNAAEAAYAAGDATTEQARIADVTTAVIEINGAILAAVAAAR